MRLSYLFSALALAGASAALQAQTTSYSQVVGYTQSTFSPGTTGQSVGFVKPEVFAGTASKLSGSSFSVSGLSLSSGSLAPANGLPTHYLEITSGANEGLAFDVLSNTGTTVVVNGSLSEVVSPEKIVIRPHVKASDVFSGNTSLVDYTDTLQVYNSDGSVKTLLRDSTSASGWVDNDSFAGTDVVIYPGQAFLLSTSGSGTFKFYGVVKENATIVPLYANGMNYVSPGNPSNNPDIQNANMGAKLTDYIDSVGFFRNDGSFVQNKVVLWAGGTDKFIDVDSFSTVTGVNVPGTGAVLVSVASDTTWKVPAPYKSQP